MQLLRNMNCLLEAHPQSRRRHLAWHTPIIVPVYPQVSTQHTPKPLLSPAILLNSVMGHSQRYHGPRWVYLDVDKRQDFCRL